MEIVRQRCDVFKYSDYFFDITTAFKVLGYLVSFYYINSYFFFIVKSIFIAYIFHKYC